MKLSPSILILKEAVLAWDGPWDGVNVLTDDVLQSNDLMELNRDPKLTFIGRVSKSSWLEKVIERRSQNLAIRGKENSLVKDIKSHGYTEKAVKQCGMRYLGPHFYENWSPDRDLNDDGTCANADVNYATQFSDRNVRFWYLGMCRVLVFSSKV